MRLLIKTTEQCRVLFPDKTDIHNLINIKNDVEDTNELDVMSIKFIQVVFWVFDMKQYLKEANGDLDSEFA